MPSLEEGPGEMQELKDAIDDERLRYRLATFRSEVVFNHVLDAGITPREAARGTAEVAVLDYQHLTDIAEGTADSEGLKSWLDTYRQLQSAMEDYPPQHRSLLDRVGRFVLSPTFQAGEWSVDLRGPKVEKK